MSDWSHRLWQRSLLSCLLVMVRYRYSIAGPMAQPRSDYSLETMKRNALIAAGNSLVVKPDAELKARIEELATDMGESVTIRQTAAAVLAALAKG